MRARAASAATTAPAPFCGGTRTGTRARAPLRPPPAARRGTPRARSGSACPVPRTIRRLAQLLREQVLSPPHFVGRWHQAAEQPQAGGGRGYHHFHRAPPPAAREW